MRGDAPEKAPRWWEVKGLTEKSTGILRHKGTHRKKHPDCERRGDSLKTNTPILMCEGIHRRKHPNADMRRDAPKKAPRWWEVKGLTEKSTGILRHKGTHRKKHPDCDRRGDSPKISIPILMCEGIHLEKHLNGDMRGVSAKKEPQWWEANVLTAKSTSNVRCEGTHWKKATQCWYAIGYT